MLHYEVKGSGHRVLVCLHGFLESLTMWSALSLEEYGQLVLIDLPGHGQSNGLDSIDSMREMAIAVRGVLEELEVTSYNVIGHSMGGYVGLELKQIDANCEKLILLNSNVWTDGEQKRIDRQRVAQLVVTKKERFVSEAIPNLFQTPENHLSEVNFLIDEAVQISAEAIGRASIAMSKRTDYTEDVFSGALEVFVIQGDKDPVADSRRMKKVFLNQKENFYLIDSGHMAHIEAREDVMRILEGILGA